MMNECEDEENLNGNPFGEESETEESPAEDVSPAEGTAVALEMVEPPQHAVPVAVATPVHPASPAKNPFDTTADGQSSSRSQEKANSNPFAVDGEEDARDPADYEYVSLVAPPAESMRIKERDWEGEWEHVATAVKKNFTSVSVVSAEVVSSMMMKHVVYVVKSEPQKYVVRRRYNDFAWLRESLAATYEGLFIPSIPATTVFGKTTLSGQNKNDVNGDFVKNRMQQLQLFLQQVSKIPFLRTDPALHSFLSVQNEKEFKQITETPVNVVNGGGVDNWTNVGLNMWLKLVDSTIINPVAAERLVGDFKRQLDLLAHRLNLVETECRAAGRKAVACATAMSALSEQVAAWSVTELDLLDPARNEYVDPYGEDKKAYMEALNIGQAHWAHSIGSVPKILARLLMTKVQFQQVQVARFKEHLTLRDTLVKELEKAERERAKANEDKVRASSPSQAAKRQSRSIMFGKTAEDLEDILQRKTDQVANLQARVDRLTRGLTFCEIHRFSRDRQQSLAAMLGALAATHLQMAAATTARWNELATQLELDLQQHAESATTLMTAAPLDDDLLGFNGGSSD